MANIKSWKNIQWRDIENKVFYLQLRIYKASANQEYDKMYKLQKLLISSKSAKYLSIRRVTQDNQEKRTSKVPKILRITPSEKFDLANKLILDGKSFSIQSVYSPYPNDKSRPLSLPTIKDRAKRMLAYLALCPQWEAQFNQVDNYRFNPGQCILDALEQIFLGISKNPKWVLHADLLKCFNQINHKYLIKKCNTCPEMQKQIYAWLKVGILDSENYVFPEIKTSEGEILSVLLGNIALHGLQKFLDRHINLLSKQKQNKRQALTFVRYINNLVLIYPDKKVLEDLKIVIQEFLEPIGLELHPTKTLLVHTVKTTNNSSRRFTFLGFDIIQRQKRIVHRKIKAFKSVGTKQSFITLITPSKEGIQKHKAKIRETIRRYKGASQETLINVLNPIIRVWVLSKRSQVGRKIFQDLNAYLSVHLWTWARKRHPKMSKIKLKNKYWHQVKNRNWVFGVKKNHKIVLQLELDNKLLINQSES
jgi:RNA-directed DNA polymerase